MTPSFSRPLQGAVALVTGGAKRVGKTISATLAAAEIKVAIHYNTSRTAAQNLAAEISKNGTEADTFQADFSVNDDVVQLVDKVVARFGRIDFLINNAAEYYPTPLGATTETEWDKLFGVNLKSAYFCAQQAAGYMKKNGSGKIVNIADVSAYSPWPDYIPYCITKAGLIAMTKGMAKALAPDILVNAIASGTVLHAPNTDPEKQKFIEENTLLKRVGSPVNIAEAALFLLKADYITGAVIPVDGGAHLKQYKHENNLK